MRQETLSEYTCEDSGRPPRVYGYGHAVVVELHGDIDLVAFSGSAPLLDAVAAGPEPVVIVDLTQVDFLDCSGLSLLMRIRRRVTARGAHMRLVCAQPLMLRMLRVTRLTTLLEPVPTLSAALAEQPAGPENSEESRSPRNPQNTEN
ncbi:STAS domain-containing protein [Streptomyces sp. NPDC046465]|uniref:STAS domain-containing protein n=1 Tax=Streptomyces sp. NPDC046465 TaxID=3155810 RepID=UPI0033C741CC